MTTILCRCRNAYRKLKQFETIFPGGEIICNRHGLKIASSEKGEQALHPPIIHRST
jgi:hypothetical protein